MGTAAVKIKLIPTSPEVDLEQIKQKAKSIVDGKGGKNCQLSEEPIAFGLNSIIVFFAWDESQELDPLENELRKIENIQSAEITDMRRAFG